MKRQLNKEDFSAQVRSVWDMWRSPVKPQRWRSPVLGQHWWGLLGYRHHISSRNPLKWAGLRNFNVMVVLEAAMSVISADGLAGSWSVWHRHPIWGGILLLSIGRSTVMGSTKFNPPLLEPPDKLIKDIWVNQKDGPIMDTNNRQRSSRSWCCVSRLKGHSEYWLCASHIFLSLLRLPVLQTS